MRALEQNKIKRDQIQDQTGKRKAPIFEIGAFRACKLVTRLGVEPRTY
jgi:hypothetical protein